ncbi:MAG: DUF2970 domain-containing protein [Pseudomonadota bacterium]
MNDQPVSSEHMTGQTVVQRKLSFLATMKAVLWSFFGVRRKSDYERDAAELNPVHVLIAGVIGAMFFVGFLVAVVKIVVSK